MEILYCRVGWNVAYRGNEGDRLFNGGSYNQDNIGHEIYNYLGYEGSYYGFVEAGINNSIHIEKLGVSKKDDHVDGVLVVWVATSESKGQRMVGWYKDATVFRVLQTVPEEVMTIRALKDHTFYNIFSKDVILLDVPERKKRIEGMGHSNIWYGNPETNKDVIDYINSYTDKYSDRISEIERNTEQLEGVEKDVVIKQRVNQDKFRLGLLDKHKHCCLCGVNLPELLVASHIKPWSKSDSHEKLDLGNGLLLCPNHDKLFDSGLISFTEDGRIMISAVLDELNQTFMNVNPKMKIKVSEENGEYLKYHREYVFKG